MSEILDWPVIAWTARALLLMVMLVIACACWAALLYLARFFRLEHVRELLRGPLPMFKSFGGSAQFLGQKVEVNATLGSVRDGQVEALTQLVGDLEKRLVSLSKSVEYLLRKGDHVKRERPGIRESVESIGDSEERRGSEGEALGPVL